MLQYVRDYICLMVLCFQNLLRSLVKENIYYDVLTKEFRDVKNGTVEPFKELNY